MRYFCLVSIFFASCVSVPIKSQIPGYEELFERCQQCARDDNQVMSGCRKELMSVEVTAYVRKVEQGSNGFTVKADGGVQDKDIDCKLTRDFEEILSSLAPGTLVNLSGTVDSWSNYGWETLNLNPCQLVVAEKQTVGENDKDQNRNNQSNWRERRAQRAKMKAKKEKLKAEEKAEAAP